MPAIRARALALVRAKLAKDHVDPDEIPSRDEMRLPGERAPPAKAGEIGGHGRDSNTTSDRIGRDAAYLATRLKHDYPDIARRLAAGEFKSVRAAARAAGLDRAKKAGLKLSQAERAILIEWLLEIAKLD